MEAAGGPLEITVFDFGLPELQPLPGLAFAAAESGAIVALTLCLTRLGRDAAKDVLYLFGRSR